MASPSLGYSLPWALELGLTLFRAASLKVKPNNSHNNWKLYWSWSEQSELWWDHFTKVEQKSYILIHLTPYDSYLLKNKDPINHNLCTASNDLLKNFININIVLKLKFFHCILLNIVFKPHWTLWMHWVGKFFRRENNFQFNPLMYKEKLHSL